MSDGIIELTERVRQDYNGLPNPIQAKFKKQLRFLADNPRHPSLNIHRIRGSTGYLTQSTTKTQRTQVLVPAPLLRALRVSVVKNGPHPNPPP